MLVDKYSIQTPLPSFMLTPSSSLFQLRVRVLTGIAKAVSYLHNHHPDTSSILSPPFPSSLHYLSLLCSSDERDDDRSGR